MTDKSQDPTTPEPEATPPAEPTEPAGGTPAEKSARRRPSRGQVLIATGALMGVLAVGSAGFAIGSATAGDGGHEDRPGHSERFDQHGPGGGPGMMPPGLPRDEQEMPDAPQAPEQSQAS
jgi:hypothetical protein